MVEIKCERRDEKEGNQQKGFSGGERKKETTPSDRRHRQHHRQIRHEPERFHGLSKNAGKQQVKEGEEEPSVQRNFEVPQKFDDTQKKQGIQDRIKKPPPERLVSVEIRSRPP